MTPPRPGLPVVLRCILQPSRLVFRPQLTATLFVLGIGKQLVGLLHSSTRALRFEVGKILLTQLALEAFGLQLVQLTLLCLDLLIQFV